MPPPDLTLTNFLFLYGPLGLGWIFYGLERKANLELNKLTRDAFTEATKANVLQEVAMKTLAELQRVTYDKLISLLEQVKSGK